MVAKIYTRFAQGLIKAFRLGPFNVTDIEAGVAFFLKFLSASRDILSVKQPRLTHSLEPVSTHIIVACRESSLRIVCRYIVSPR